MQERYEQHLANCRELIKKHGHMVQMVVGGTGSLAYTVGLTPKLGYELATMLLPQDTAMHLLNSMARALIEAPREDGENVVLPDFPMPFRLRRVELREGRLDRTVLVSTALKLGLQPAFVRQVVWPSPSGKFEGEPGYDFHVMQTLDKFVD